MGTTWDSHSGNEQCINVKEVHSAGCVCTLPDRGGNKVLWLCSHTCPSTPDLIQSHTSYVSTYSSFCSVIYILSGRLELCHLGSIAFFTTLLCTVDARQMDYKLEQFQSPRMHSSVTIRNSNTVQGNKANFLGTGSKIVVHKHATPTQVKAVV